MRMEDESWTSESAASRRKFVSRTVVHREFRDYAFRAGSKDWTNRQVNKRWPPGKPPCLQWHRIFEMSTLKCAIGTEAFWCRNVPSVATIQRIEKRFPVVRNGSLEED